MEGVATGYLALGWNNVSQTVSICVYTVYIAMANLLRLTKPLRKKVIPANVRVFTLDDKGGYSCVNRRVNTRILT